MKIKEGKQIGFVIKKGINVDKQFQYGKCIFEQGFDSANVGVSEVTLNGTIGKNLKSYTIKGNTVQNGTPTPDNPVEVLGVGDKTANLFDKSTITVGNFATVSGTIANNSYYCSDFIPITATTYYFQNAVGGTYQNTVVVYDANKQGLRYAKLPGTTKSSGAITFQSGDAYIRINCYYQTDVNTVMANIGNTVIPYEPYGYKIPVTTIGKNLFDVSSEYNVHASMAINTGRFPANTDGNRHTYFFKVKPNAEYTISFSDVSDRLVVVGYNQIINPLEYSAESLIPSYRHRIGISEGLKNYTFTTESDEIMVGIYYALDVVPDEIMLIEGSTALPYEPYREPVVSNVYLDEPLHSDDYIKLNTDGSGVVHREWGVKVFDGSEEWFIVYSTSQPHRFTTKSIEDRMLGSIPTCSHYIGSNVTNYSGLKDGEISVSTAVAADNKPRTTIRDNRFETESDFAAYLAEQYAAGTPVTVIYQLATPTDTPITLPDIPTLRALPPLHTYDGATTVISVDTTVSPSKFDAAYKSNVSNSHTIEYHTADNIGFASADGAVFTTRY